MRKLLALAILFALPTVASASFHLMQIEQVIAGVGGDTTQQAIQLRMRSDFQNQVAQATILVVDATGANQLVVININGNVTNFNLGDRVLIASANFIAMQGVVADFTMTTLIPQSYFNGGQLIFEHDTGTRYWLLCWGNYSGSVTGDLTNDTDGNFGPCATPTLPFSGVDALKFGGAATARSTTNLGDYALTSGPATVTNNARQSFVVLEPPLFADGFE